MDDSYTQAIKEAYRSVGGKDNIVYDTLEISHPNVVEPKYIVNDRVALTATLEDLSTVTFQPVGFKFKRPSSNSSGVSEMTITIDDVNREASDFIDACQGSKIPPTLKWRCFISSDLSQPGNDPPIVLYLTSVKFSDFVVTGRAAFANIVNKPFLHILYRRSSHPGLAN